MQWHVLGVDHPTYLWLSCCILCVRLPGFARKVSKRSVSPKAHTGTRLAPV